MTAAFSGLSCCPTSHRRCLRRGRKPQWRCLGGAIQHFFFFYPHLSTNSGFLQQVLFDLGSFNGSSNVEMNVNVFPEARRVVVANSFSVAKSLKETREKRVNSHSRVYTQPEYLGQYLTDPGGHMFYCLTLPSSIGFASRTCCSIHEC